MNPFAALTIKLHANSPKHYVMGLELHLHLIERQIDVQQLPAEGLPVTIPWTELLSAKNDPVAYGRHLSAALFDKPVARTALAVARTQADAAGLSLHVGLDLNACAPEVQALAWETFQDPDPGHVGWGISERLLLSRRLASSDMLSVEPRSGPAQSALIAIAAPSDLNQYGFSSIPVGAELNRACAALRPLRLSTLAQAQGRPCTVQHLLTALRSGPDIFCLVAHGRSVSGEVHIWLEDERGQSAPLASSELAARLTALSPSARPSLIVFSICESGGADAIGIALPAIGPMLADHGVAAVLAMHGLLSFDTNAAFLPAFLRETLRDGVIDRAVAAGRSVVSDRQDWWAPILWLRLPHGRLWAPFSAGRLRGSSSHVPVSPQQGATMNTTRGFVTFKAYLTNTGSEELANVNTLEAKLIELRKKERLFGSTPQRSSEFAEIMHGLNAISIEQCGMSFNDLCEGGLPE